MPPLLFPFAEYWWFYAAFTAFVLMMLALDLGVFHRKAHAVGFREATAWSAAWISLSLIFNYLLYLYSSWRFAQVPRLMSIPGFNPDAAARQVSLEFLTGYLIEKALSVDNIFVFVLVFGYFAIPAKYQHRVLFYGILGALVFRAMFIAVGAALMQYHAVVIIFGVFLVVTGVRMLFGQEKKLEPEKNPVIKLIRRTMPVTPDLQGQRFFVRLNRKFAKKV
jgi:tellurite resistance protein TerC